MTKEFTTKEVRGTRSVGERLRLARKRQRITLEETERDTKIRLKYLESLEKGWYREMPSEVYALGFLRRYAEYLSLKPDPLITLYKTELKATNGKKEKVKPIRELSVETSVPKWQFFITPKTLLLTIIAILIIGLFGYIWWAVSNFSAPPALSITSPKNDAVISGDSLTVKGKTDIGAFVLINNEPVNVSPDGQFTQEVNLNEGMNTVEIIAKNKLDRRTVRVIKILSENGQENKQTNP